MASCALRRGALVCAGESDICIRAARRGAFWGRRQRIGGNLRWKSSARAVRTTVSASDATRDDGSALANPEVSSPKARKFRLIREGKMGVGKVRQHVNPLRRNFQRDVPTPAYDEMFADAGKPLHLDVGCAKGGWLTKVAAENPERNHLGLEIRELLVAHAAHNAEHLENCDFKYANVNVSLRTIIAPYPGQLELVTINNLIVFEEKA